MNQHSKTLKFRPQTLRLEDRTVPASLSVGPNVDIGPILGNQNEISMAINPADPDNIVAVSNDESIGGGLRFYRTMDGGATWSNRVIGINDALGMQGCCDGQVTFDSFGNLFMVFVDLGGVGTVNVITSSNGGLTLTRHEMLGAGVDQPSISAGGGAVWVSWNQGTIQAAGAAVVGLGMIGPFNAQFAVPGADGNFGNIAVGPNGQVAVTYQAPAFDAGPSQIFANIDPDGLGPMGFGQPILVSDTQVGGFRIIPAQDTAHGIDAEANLYYDRSFGPHRGRLYCVYTDAPNPVSDDTDTFVRFSDDNGSTWSARVRVNDDATTNSQYLPSGAVDPTTGNLAIGWLDSRNAGPTNTTAQYFVTVSEDGGATFLPNVQVSSGTSDASIAGANVVGYGDYLSLDFFNNRIAPVWADNSPTLPGNPTVPQFDCATAVVTFIPGGPPIPPVVLHGTMVVGQDSGGTPLVRLFDLNTGVNMREIMAYDARFRGGVRVAYADVNGDGTPDIITAPGEGGGPHIKVFDGRNFQPLLSPIGNFMAYDPNFRGGAFVAAGDVNGDGFADVITGAGFGGGPHVRVFSGFDGSVIAEFMAYDPNFRGGVTVAAGDVNGDGFADVVTGAGRGGGPHVEAFDIHNGQLIFSLFAYDANFHGGVFVATGDVDGDGRADIVTGAGAGGGSHVRVFSALDGSGLASFFAYSNVIGSTMYVGNSKYNGGVRITAQDADGDGRADILAVPGREGNPTARFYTASGNPLGALNLYDPSFLGGVFVA
jgi:hypothetical protein